MEHQQPVVLKNNAYETCEVKTCICVLVTEQGIDTLLYSKNGVALSIYGKRVQNSRLLLRYRRHQR